MYVWVLGTTASKPLVTYALSHLATRFNFADPFFQVAQIGWVGSGKEHLGKFGLLKKGPTPLGPPGPLGPFVGSKNYVNSQKYKSEVYTFSALETLFLMNRVEHQILTHDSRAAIWLSFSCSTRPSADTGTNFYYQLLHHHAALGSQNLK